MQAQKWGRGMTVDVFNLGTSWGSVVNSTARLQNFGAREEKVGRTPRPVWTSVERRKSLASFGVRSPNLPALGGTLF